MVDEPAATRREVNDIRIWVGRIEARIDSIDREGTRSMSAVLLQVTEINKDVSELRADMVGWQKDHEALHTEDRNERRSARRWGWSFGVASLLGVWGALVPLVIVLVTHTR